MSTKIIVCTSQKGGVTKTTTTVSIAHALARTGASVLIVDTDNQGHAATLLGLDPAPGIYDAFIRELPLHMCLVATGRPNLTLLPSNQKTKSAADSLRMQMLSGDMRPDAPAAILRNIGRDYQYVVIDTPASGLLQQVALEVADVVVIPTALDYLGLDGVGNTMATLQKLGRQDVQTIILPTLYERRLAEHTHNFGILMAAYPGLIAKPVPSCAAVREAISAGKTVWEWTAPGQTLPAVKMAYVALVEWICEGGPVAEAVAL